MLFIGANSLKLIACSTIHSVGWFWYPVKLINYNLYFDSENFLVPNLGCFPLFSARSSVKDTQSDDMAWRIFMAQKDENLTAYTTSRSRRLWSNCLRSTRQGHSWCRSLKKDLNRTGTFILFKDHEKCIEILRFLNERFKHKMPQNAA